MKETDTRTLSTPVSSEEHRLGSPDARAVLVAYGDYQCPYTAEALFVVQGLLKGLGNNLCYVFRNFPLRKHPDAERAALAAEAADKQGKFWEMHELLFRNQTALSSSDLSRYARELGLDVERFETDLKAGETKNKVRDDVEGGKLSGVYGTPTFFLNGACYGDEYDTDAFLIAVASTATGEQAKTGPAERESGA